MNEHISTNKPPKKFYAAGKFNSYTVESKKNRFNNLDNLTYDER